MATGYTPPGATCCCGGDTTNCCPYGDGDAPQICVTFPAGVWPTALSEAMFGGRSFTLTQSITNCLWQGSFADYDTYTDGGCTYSLGTAIDVGTGVSPSATGGLYVGTSGGASYVSGSGCASGISVGMTTDFGAATAAPGCKPQTIPAGGFLLQGSFYTVPAGILIEDGPCGAMMASPRLTAATGPAAPARGYRPPPPARPRICLYADRVEFLAGCSGFRCRHRCTSPDPGVRAALGESDIVLPADECQTCPGFTPRP